MQRSTHEPRRPSRMARLTAVSLFAMAAWLAAPASVAAPPKNPNAPAANPSQYGAKKLEAARDALQAEDWEAAGQALDELEKRRPNAYEKALAYQFRGYIANGQEDIKGALAWFEKALATEGLSYSQTLDMSYVVAQINIALGNYKAGIERLEYWFEEVRHPESPKRANESNYYLLALAYYQIENVDKAVLPARKARALGKPKPRQSTLELLVALYHAKEDYKAVGKLLTELIELYPKKSYFLQLSGVLSQLGRNSEALAIQQLAYHRGWLDKEGEVRTLAQMLMSEDMPYPAARVMSDALEKKVVKPDVDNYKLLADAWLLSREVEKSYGPLEKAASLATDGQMFMRLGQAYIEGAKWQEAEGALQAAIAKGGLKSTCSAHLLVGVTRFNRDRLGSARGAFQRATGCQDTREAAQRWVGFIDRKLAQARAAEEANNPTPAKTEEATDGDEATEAAAGTEAAQQDAPSEATAARADAA